MADYHLKSKNSLKSDDTRKIIQARSSQFKKKY
jgi:hypothetical protein